LGIKWYNLGNGKAENGECGKSRYGAHGGKIPPGKLPVGDAPFSLLNIMFTQN